jgi:hypothetical protein
MLHIADHQSSGELTTPRQWFVTVMTTELPRGRAGGRGQGGGEHLSERTLVCVSEGAEPPTQAWAVRAAALV